MSKIIIINGQGGVGKDTFIELCSKNTKRAVCNISSVAPIKEVAKILDWNGEKDKKGRKLLSDLKRISKEYNNFPVKYMLYSIKRAIKDHDDPLIFLHIREPEEINEIKETLDEAITVLMVKGKDIIDSYGNVSDDCVYKYNYDFVFINDGSIKDLCVMAKKFLNEIGSLEMKVEFCNVCKKSTNFTEDGKCISCKERNDIEFDKRWHSKSLDEKVDWIYREVWKIKND